MPQAFGLQIQEAGGTHYGQEELGDGKRAPFSGTGLNTTTGFNHQEVMNVPSQSTLSVKQEEREPVYSGLRNKEDVRKTDMMDKNIHSNLAFKIKEKMKYNHFTPTRTFIITTTVKGNNKYW